MPKAKTATRKDGDKFTTFAEGGRVYPAADIDGNEFVLAAQKYGLDDRDTRVLNKIVRLVNQGESVDSAAKKVAMQDDKYAEGGEVSRVNEAGNYTKPGMRKKLFESIKAGGKGGAPGQWSARKAQMLAQQYKKAGGGYRD
jgi:hypothetical protein